MQLLNGIEGMKTDAQAFGLNGYRRAVNRPYIQHFVGKCGCGSFYHIYISDDQTLYRTAARYPLGIAKHMLFLQFFKMLHQGVKGCYWNLVGQQHFMSSMHLCKGADGQSG